LALYIKYGNPYTPWDRYLINFTVAAEGDKDVQNVVYGDCLSYWGSGETNLAENAIYISGDISDYWNRTIIWLLLTVLVTGGCWAALAMYNKRDKGINTTMAALICMFMLLIGAISRMIEWVYIGVILVIVVAILGLKLARMVTKE